MLARHRTCDICLRPPALHKHNTLSIHCQPVCPAGFVLECRGPLLQGDCVLPDLCISGVLLSGAAAAATTEGAAGGSTAWQTETGEDQARNLCGKGGHTQGLALAQGRALSRLSGVTI